MTPRHPKQNGFTLVEMLVAITIMAVMAGLSWRGLDAMSQSRAINRAHQQQVLALQASLAQWGTDLDALVQTPYQHAMVYDGKLMRLVRQSAIQSNGSASLVVVAYATVNAPGNAANGGPSGLQWLRWQSPPIADRGQLQTQWAAALQWANGLTADTIQPAVALATVQEWSVNSYQGGAWTPLLPPTSQAGATALPLPEALRLKLQLSESQPITGTLIRDWIRPTAGGTR